jgi:hypothetical protein
MSHCKLLGKWSRTCFWVTLVHALTQAVPNAENGKFNDWPLEIATQDLESQSQVNHLQNGYSVYTRSAVHSHACGYKKSGP